MKANSSSFREWQKRYATRRSIRMVAMGVCDYQQFQGFCARHLPWYFRGIRTGVPQRVCLPTQQAFWGE